MVNVKHENKNIKQYKTTMLPDGYLNNWIEVIMSKSVSNAGDRARQRPSFWPKSSAAPKSSTGVALRLNS